MNLTIRQKIFFGYLIIISLTLSGGVYAILSLFDLNKITTQTVAHAMTVGDKVTKLNDSILAQDLYEKRFLMLRQADAENLFWYRSREFRMLLAEIAKADEYLKPITESIAAAHDQYNGLFTKESSLLEEGRTGAAGEVSSGELKNAFEKVLLALRDIDIKTKSRQAYFVTQSNALSRRALVITTTLIVLAVLLGLFFSTLITRHLTSSIVRLKEATHLIQSGDFDNLPEIHGADELADLAVSFKEMSARLKQLEEMNLDANPLTKLPGNLAIEKELLTRLNETQRFSFCLIDLDNFKAYSDRYGYARGSEVLKWLAELLGRIRAEYGDREDFLGHIGGDDFVLICSPNRVQTICSKIIEEFDRGIVEHYDQEDAKKGFIISVDRHDKPALFGIMTISIAVVNTDRTLVREPKEIAQKVAELKQYAKQYAKSIYIMDRRRSK